MGDWEIRAGSGDDHWTGGRRPKTWSKMIKLIALWDFHTG